jgi:hypothetical protein
MCLQVGMVCAGLSASLYQLRKPDVKLCRAIETQVAATVDDMTATDARYVVLWLGWNKLTTPPLPVKHPHKMLATSSSRFVCLCGYQRQIALVVHACVTFQKMLWLFYFTTRSLTACVCRQCVLHRILH